MNKKRKCSEECATLFPVPSLWNLRSSNSIQSQNLPTRHKTFRILPTPWSEFETSETYLAGRCQQEHRLHM